MTRPDPVFAFTVAAVLIAVFRIGPFSPKGSLDKLKKQAEQGDAAAQNDLGFAYYKGNYNGKEVDQDYENRMDSNDEYLEYWMHEAEYWRDQCNADD